MDSRNRAVFHHRHQRGTVFVTQTGRLSGRLAGNQPLRALGIESQHPVTHHLQGHPADLGCLRPTAAVIDHGQSQEPPNLVGVRARPGNPA